LLTSRAANKLKAVVAPTLPAPPMIATLMVYPLLQVDIRPEATPGARFRTQLQAPCIRVSQSTLYQAAIIEE
jgi:hypothetical protein